MANPRVKALIDEIKELESNDYEQFLKELEIVDGAKEDEKIEPETEETEGKGVTEEMTNDEQQITEAEKDAEEKGEEPTKAEIDESVSEQEHIDGNENSQSAEDRVDESEGAEKADEKHQDTTEARLDKLEELLSKVIEMLAPKNEAGTNLDEKKEKYGLGSQPVVTQGAEEYDEKKINQLLGR